MFVVEIYFLVVDDVTDVSDGVLEVVITGHVLLSSTRVVVLRVL